MEEWGTVSHWSQSSRVEKEGTRMMGTKGRAFAPLVDVSLEELVPATHFYRHLERTLDLSFVRDLVAPLYAAGGRPSIDPIVFFKLQLVLFFEGLRSERHLMRLVADHLGARWYVGYDLDEALPDHSSLTKIRGTRSPRRVIRGRTSAAGPRGRRPIPTALSLSTSKSSVLAST